MSVHNFKLPPWAGWKPEDWRGGKESRGEIIENPPGWNITDFGSGRFAEIEEDEAPLPLRVNDYPNYI